MQKLSILIAALMLAACAESQTNETPNAIGVVNIEVTDASRTDLVTETAPRRWAVRVIYPACGGGAPADYIDDALVDVMKAEAYYGLEDAVMESWRERKVGVKNAAPCGTAVPMATLSIGLGVSGAHYSLLAEKLAGEGYAVAIIDHPYGAPSILPDGTIFSASDDEALARIDEDPAVLAARMADWVADISGTLSALTSGGVAGLNIDGERLAAIGHSMGGAAALDACASDARIKVCVNMDGAPFGAKVMDQGLFGNAFVLLSDPLYTDEELASRGRSREQWEAMGEQITGLWAELVGSGENETVILRVLGTGHMSFSDAPRVAPGLITSFGGNPMEPARAMDVISGALTAIMESKIGMNEAALDGYIEKTPELERVQ